MASSGFKINRQGIEQMTRDIQREFNKHPIRIPLQADDESLRAPVDGSANYYGPVIYVQGDGAQLAWNNESVTQAQDNSEQITPGFEALAQALVSMLQAISDAGLDPEDLQATEDSAKIVLKEVTRPEPDRGVIRRALATVKGFLSPIALGISRGTTDGAEEWAKTAIEQLGNSF